MTWGLAKFAARMARSVSARRGRVQNAKSTGLHGPAQITAPRLKPDGPRTLPDILASRAKKSARGIGQQRLHLRRHLILAKGTCSDGH